ANASGNRGWAFRLSNAGIVGIVMLPSTAYSTTGAVGFASGPMGGGRCTRNGTTGVCTIAGAADSPVEPTTGWTSMALTGSPQAGAVPVTTGPGRTGDR